MNSSVRYRSPSRHLAVAGLLLIFSALSCGREPTGPGGPDGVQLSQGLAFLTKFPDGYEELRREAQSGSAGGSSLVAFARVRITLRRASNNQLMLTEERDFTAASADLPVTLSITLPADSPAGGLPLLLTLEYLTVAGAVVFTGGPAAVTAVPVVPGQVPPATVPVSIPIQYTGPGAGASGVRFTVAPASVDAGQTFTFVAQAHDAAGIAIPNVPILYSSLNPAFASINAATGAGTAGPIRGQAGIEARLLTGPTAISQLTIISPARSIAAVPSAARRGPVGSTLTDPVVVRVLSADGLPPSPGVTVTFSAANAGTATPVSGVTDANGEARTSWRLGSLVGAQSLTASAAGLTGSPVTFTATGLAVDPVRLVFGQQPPSSTAAGVVLTPAITVQAVDETGATTTAYTGEITVALGAGAPNGAALSGTTRASAVAGVATFADLRIGTLGSYTLVASAASLAGASSNGFAVVAGAARGLVFQNYPVIGASALGVLDQITVSVRDALNNPVTAFTGSVTLSANGPSAVGAESAAAAAGVIKVSSETGDQANALLGNTTVNAVAGIATFTGIRLTSAGSYTFTAASAGLNSAIGPPFVIAPGPASVIALVSGRGQSAAGGAALASPVVIRVTDAVGNGIPGVTVNFSPTAGHGSVTPTSAMTNGAGMAQTTWTLAGAIGAKSLTVTSGSLTPLVVGATATTASGAARTWTGATSSAFEVPTNWSPAGVPGPADQLSIPIVSPQPTNTGTIAVGSLTLASGTTLANSGVITVNGSVDAGLPAGIRQSAVRQVGSVASVFGAGITGNGQIILAGGGGSTFIGIVTNQLVVSGTYTLTDFAQVEAAFQIISGGTLTVNGGYLQVGGDFHTVGTGKLVMTSTGDEVTIVGNANFGGGSEHGFLTAGTLRVNRNFTATGASFSATGSHRTVFDGDTESTQTISFTSPVAGRGFFHVGFEGLDEKVLVGSFTAMGAVSVESDASKVSGPGVTAKIGGHFSDATFVLSDTLGAWRVPTTEFFATGTINSQFLTTNVIVSGGTRTMAPYASGTEGVLAGRSGGASLRAGTGMGSRTRSRTAMQARIVDAGYTQINGGVTVTGATALLDINSTELYVEGDFATASGGKLKMMNENDRLRVGGNATFAGGSTAGLLTGGVLLVLGDFTQGGGASAFAPDPGFYTQLGGYYSSGDLRAGERVRASRNPRTAAMRAPTDGSFAAQGAQRAASQAAGRAAAVAARDARNRRFEPLRAARDARRARLDRRAAAYAARGLPQPSDAVVAGSPGVRRATGRANSTMYPIVTFANPTSSFFGTLYVQSDISLGSDVKVAGRFETGGGYDFYINSTSAAPRTLTSHGADIYDVNFDNVRWILLDGSEVWSLDYVKFDNMDPTVDQFTLSRTGDIGGGEDPWYYSLSDWEFYTTPTTGNYIRATDTSPGGLGGANVVTLNMMYPSPSTHGGHVATAGGAVIANWVASFDWLGTVSSAWSNGANWTTGFAPWYQDDVTIKSAAPNNPVLSTTSYVRSLTIEGTKTIDVASYDLHIYGNLTAPLGAPAILCGTGGVANFFGSSASITGNICNAVIYGTYQVAGQVIVSLYFTVAGGDININGGRLDVGGVGGTGVATLSTTSGGTVTMTNAADRVFVGSGGAYFQGGSTTDKLTAGIMTLVNSSAYNTTGAASAFAPSGSHSVVLAGTSTKFQFASPASSGVNNVSVPAGMTVELYSNVQVKGTLARSGGGSASIVSMTGVNQLLTVAGLNLPGSTATTFSKVLISFIDGTANGIFNNATFSGYTNPYYGAASTGSLFESMRTTGGTFSFAGLNFGGAGFSASGTGHFINQNGSVDISITAATPGSGTLGTHYIKPGSGALNWP